MTPKSQSPPSGLATLAGALGDWDDLDEMVAEIYAARSNSPDRPGPDLVISDLPKHANSPKKDTAP